MREEKTAFNEHDKKNFDENVNILNKVIAKKSQHWEYQLNHP